MDASAPRIGSPRVGPRPRGLVAFLWNSNPFYPISAALVLLGLRSSYDPSASVFPTWATLGGLAAYASLLAGMAILLVRRMRAWEDVRTIVLLVALVVFAAPAFFDDVLTRDPGLGVACELAGLAFAMALSEAILRGLALRMPLGFRVPYHLSLVLFYLHPAALSPLLSRPDDPALLWALFAFPALAGFVALTLLPAARRGPAYVAKDGTPWKWPFYPWSLFVFIALGVCARSATHCLAVNYSGGTQGYESIDGTIFGPYFLVPFALGVAAVLLEIGLASGNRAAVRTSLVMPMALVVVAGLGHRPDAVYQRFLGEFLGTVGATPMFAALAAATFFYAVAACRGVRGSIDLMTIAIASMSFVGPQTLDLNGLTDPQAVPLVMASLVQAALAISRANAWRGLVSLAGLVASTLIGPYADWSPVARGLASGYLCSAGLMTIAIFAGGAMARALRGSAAVVLVLVWTAPLWLGPGVPSLWPYAVVPMLMAVGYGWLAQDRGFGLAVAMNLVCWTGRYGSLAYTTLRRSVPGLDQITLGLAFFGLAALISLAKAGALPDPGVFHRRQIEPNLLGEEPAA